MFQKVFHIPASAVDRHDRLKMSTILDYLQEIAGDHCALLSATRADLLKKNLFWAVIRHRVVITRLPKAGEDIQLTTWPMPTTRTAYPRAVLAVDSEGKELFRSVSLWVLMDMTTRAMVLPGKSGVTVEGQLLGGEIEPAGAMAAKERANSQRRAVRYTDLDWNGHMNNCRYLDWVDDLTGSDFHQNHSVTEFSVCYFSEAREGEILTLNWELGEDGDLCVDAVREEAVSTGGARVFSVRATAK